MALHINKIRITNILGIDELEFSPDQFTAITGGNGSGKTSILEAIKSALRGGHDATILRKGTEKGEVVLELDDGTEITKRVFEDASDTRVKQNGKTVARAAETIKGLADLLAVNPVEFLTASKKDRVDVLLKSMPVEADHNLLCKITGLEISPSITSRGIQSVDAVRKMVFDERTVTNRLVKEKESTISQLRQTVPDLPDGVSGDEDSLQNAITYIDTAKQAEMDRITTKLDTLKNEAQAKIDAIRDELAKTERIAASQREKKLAEFAAQREPVAAQLQVIRQNREAEGRRLQTLDTIAQMDTDLTALIEAAESQTTAIGELDDYKLTLLNNLPIKGIEVVDGEIYRDGVQFDRLNTAQKVDIAVDIAKLRSGELGIICVDGLELLDGEHYEDFRKAAIESGLQLFVTRVGNGERTISNQ